MSKSKISRVVDSKIVESGEIDFEYVFRENLLR